MYSIHTERPSKKLNYKKIGPYPITEVVGLSYRLELPTSIQIHDVFHPNLFRLAAKDSLSSQINDPPSPIVVNNKKKWEADNIFNAKKHGKY